MKKTFLLSLLMLAMSPFAISQIDTTIVNSVYDWKKVKVFQEEEFDSTRHLTKITPFQFAINIQKQPESEIRLRGQNLLKQITAQFGGCATRIVYDQMNAEHGAYIYQPIPNGRYTISAIFYRCGEQINIDEVNRFINGRKKIKVIERQNIQATTLGNFRADSTKFNATISSVKTSPSGEIQIDASIPEEVTLTFRVVAITDKTMTIMPRKEIFNTGIITYVLSKE